MSNNLQIQNITEKEQFIFMKNLRYLMTINSFTGLSLSEETGISVNAIRSYAIGRRIPNEGNAKKLADVFNVTRYDLLFVDLEERDADTTNPVLDRTEWELIYHFRNLDSLTQQNIFGMIKTLSNAEKEKEIKEK